MAAPQAASSARHFRADIFRPVGNKIVATGVAGLTGAGAGAVQQNINGQVDLSTPLKGFRFIVKGRVVVATANYTSANPESFLNLVSKIRIVGTNKLQGGNVTIVDSDLASLYAFAMLNQYQNGFIEVTSGGVVTLVARPGIPYANLAALTTGTYDFIISFDLPLAPFGIPELAESAFIMRATEWTNAVNIHLEFPAVPDNSANPLGTSATTTVTTISGFGGGGTMTVDIYELPVLMGKSRSSLVPGILSRTSVPLGAVLQSSLNNGLLITLEKQATARVYLKIGIGTAFPVFTSLSDTVLSALGIQIGTDKNVRNLVDIYAERSDACDDYDVPPIQGYFMLDFLNKTGNPDRAYPGDQLDASQTFRLIGSCPGTANAQGEVLQEQIIYKPTGSLFG